MDRGIWWTRRAWGLHLTLLVTVPTFLALCWWQVHRALSGNDLSWAYVFEWPFFAAYAVYLWWRLVHDPPGAPSPAAEGPTPAGTAVAAEAAPDGRGGTDGVRALVSDGGREATAAAGAGAGGAGNGTDEELAAYNRYLAALAASDRRKQW